MSPDAKIEQLTRMAYPDELGFELADALIEQSKWIVLNRRYPFGTTLTEVPARFEQVQLQIALELYTRMGAEGQTNHTENDIQRIWENSGVSTALLKQIPPVAAVPGFTVPDTADGTQLFAVRGDS